MPPLSVYTQSYDGKKFFFKIERQTNTVIVIRLIIRKLPPTKEQINATVKQQKGGEYERHDLNRVINLKPLNNARKQQSTRKWKQSTSHESVTGFPSGPEW